MHSFFKTIINRIPPLPESVTQIESFAKNHNTSYKKVANTLEQDPILTSEILKAANAPIYGFSHTIGTLENTISLFGLGTVRGFILAVYIRDNFDFNLGPYSMTAHQFSSTASMRNAFARDWYFKQKPQLFDLLSPATFLSNLGQVLISQYLLEKNKVSEFKESLLKAENSNSVEKKFCNITAVELSAEIFENWSFEKNFTNTLRSINNPLDNTSAQILHSIHTLIAYNGVINNKNVEKAKILVKRYNLDIEGFVKTIKEFK